MAFSNEYVILSTQNYIDAEQTVDLLENAGIVCYIKGSATGGVFGDTSAFSIGGPEAAIEVVIHVKDAEAAERALEAGNADDTKDTE